MLILAIPKDFYKLLEDSRLTPIAPLSKLGGIVVMAIDLTIMLIVAILCPKNGRANGACEVIDMVLVI